MLQFVTHVFTPSAGTIEAIQAMEQRWPLTAQEDANQILIKVVEGVLPITDAVELLREYTFVFTEEFEGWFRALGPNTRAELFDYLMLAGVELRAKLRHLKPALSATVGASPDHPYMRIVNWDMEVEHLRPGKPH